MDDLTIFKTPSTQVNIESEEDYTLDTVVGELKDVVRELKLTRAGHQEYDWGEDIEDGEIDLTDIGIEEEEGDD